MYEAVSLQDDRLKKYIPYIYRFSTDDPSFQRRLIIFPNVGSAIAIYKDLRFSSEDVRHFLSVEEKGNSGVILHLNRTDPITIKEKGRQKRIVIVLTPLGINQFCDRSPAELLKVFHTEFAEYTDISPRPLRSQRETYHNPSYIPLDSIFKEFSDFAYGPLMNEPLKHSLPEIEKLLSERFKPFTNSVLENCLTELDRDDRLIKLEQISRQIGVSTKTMYRLFKNYIGLSPVEYRKVKQFRNALESKLHHPATNFTDVAMDNSYYDLPYMSKVFKELTGFNYSEFFHKISHSEDLKYVFMG